MYNVELLVMSSLFTALSAFDAWCFRLRPPTDLYQCSRGGAQCSALFETKFMR